MLNPFIGFVQAFRYYKQDWAKNSVWLFVAFYGYTMLKIEGMDSSAYVGMLKLQHNTAGSWRIIVSKFYNEGGDFDLYQPLITSLLSLFTDNGNILFFVYGLTFGYFYSRNIWKIFGLFQGGKISKIQWLLVLTFGCIIGFWELNGVRMWTAAHIFFYGTFIYFFERNKKGLLLVFSSLFVHFSFILPVGLLILFLVIKLPRKILYIAFLFSLSISTLNIESIRVSMETYLPDFLFNRVGGYLGDGYVEIISEAKETVNWYIKYHSDILIWFTSIMISVIYFKSKSNIWRDKIFSDLFRFTLLFLAVGNIMSMLPSGTRYLMIAQLFAIALLTFYYASYSNMIFKKWIIRLSPLLFIYIVVSFRMSLTSISVLTIFGNPLLALLIDVQISLMDLIK